MFVSRGGRSGSLEPGTCAVLALVVSVVIGSLLPVSAVAQQPIDSIAITTSVPVTTTSAVVSTVPSTTVVVASPSSVVSSSSTVPPVSPAFLVAVEERTYDGAGVLVGVRTTSESVATVEGDAAAFAARRRGGVIRFFISEGAAATLRAAGAKLQLIPPGNMFPLGNEFFIPESVFDLFNKMLDDGAIYVTL
jgi:hypothetical protein